MSGAGAEQCAAGSLPGYALLGQRTTLPLIGFLGGQVHRFRPRGSFSLQSGQSPVSAFDANQ